MTLINKCCNKINKDVLTYKDALYMAGVPQQCGRRPLHGRAYCHTA
jgi:hypothetical protein